MDISKDVLEALLWIRNIANVNIENDPKLRADGARALARISKKANDTILLIEAQENEKRKTN